VTHAETAKWIRRIFFLLVAAGVAAGVWFYPKSKTAAAPDKAGPPEKYDLEVFHYHLPGNSESEQLVEILNKVEKKYGQVLIVNRVDITEHPEKAIAEKVTKPPKVVMMAGEVRACKFQGLWTQAQIERKVDEILRGVKRVDKDWRPEVQGMQPAANSTPVPPGKR
jgi:hypothetical protein